MEREQALAFRHEFYEKATDGQIRDDIVSYLAEYRFEVSEFEYRLGILDDQLVDPNSQEPMTAKAKKAIATRRKYNLGTSREEAELEGLSVLERRIKKNPTGTVIWFSPPGPKEDGYGDYGFAYTGKVEEGELRMTAIRLENPSIEDFKVVATSMLGEDGQKDAEDFLRNPKVVDIDEDRAKEFIHGVFEIKTKETKRVFEKALGKMEGAIESFTHVVKTGTALQIQEAINAMENLSIEFKERLGRSFQDNVVFLADYKAINLYDAMRIQRYISKPPPVFGSCGMSGKIESSNIFTRLFDSTLFNKSSQEWFNCPKCTYKADGPIGNKCPGCGLTKEEYAQNGGLACE